LTKIHIPGYWNHCHWTQISPDNKQQIPPIGSQQQLLSALLALLFMHKKKYLEKIKKKELNKLTTKLLIKTQPYKKKNELKNYQQIKENRNY